MRLTFPTLCLSLAACTTGEDDWQEWLAPVDFEGSEAIELGAAVGQGTIEIPVRLVNSYKATIPGTEVTVSVEGPTAVAQSTTVTLDALGQGSVWVDVAGPEVFTVTVTSSADEAEVGASIEAYAVSVPLPDYTLGLVSPYDHSIEDAPTSMAMGTGGVIISASDELWWHPADGGPAYRVADLPADLDGMRSAHVDADGVLDLVTWAGNQVMLFRGRAGGGLAWGGGFIGDSGDIAGVAVADLDSNRTTDLAIALTGGGSGVVQLLSGTGSWGFESMGRPLELNHGILGISAADEGTDGWPDVTVIAESHEEMRRYTLSDEGWVGATTFNLSSADGSECNEGSELLPMVDLDGDGDLEVTIAGPPTDVPQELIFFLLGETVKHYPLTYGSFFVDLADMNEDGATDITLLEDGTLHYIHFDGADFKDDTITLDRQGGPIASGDLNQDGIGDVAIASNGVAFTSGMVGDTGNWSQDNGNWSSFSTNLLAEPVITDIDGDGISDVVGLSSNGDTIVASAWRLLNDSKGTEMLYLGSAELGASTEAHQIIRCDYGGSEDYFALVGDGKNETIYRLSVSTSGVDEEASTATNGTIMHCGEGWDTNAWTPYVVVVSSSAGSWTSYRRALGSEDSGSMGSIGDFAMLPNEVVGCSEDGCSMLATDLDGDEILELVTMDSTGLTVEWGDGSEPSVHAGSGLLTVQDADGDGREDILATDVETGRIWIYRNLVNGIAPAVGLHTIRDLTSRVSLGDVTADGVPELILVDADGRIIHSEATEADPASSW